MRLFEGTEFDIPPRCERCNELEVDCECALLPEPELPRTPPEKQRAKVFTENRRGKRVVTIVKNLEERDLKELLTKLKGALGTGGTIKDGQLELQGDRVSRAKEFLKVAGYRIQ